MNETGIQDKAKKVAKEERIGSVPAGERGFWENLDAIALARLHEIYDAKDTWPEGQGGPAKADRQASL